MGREEKGRKGGEQEKIGTGRGRGGRGNGKK